jgi:hypothetical protein
MDRGLNLVPREGPPTWSCALVCHVLRRDPGKVLTKITALVEPPDWDLDLTASEGGCRLMIAVLGGVEGVEEFEHSGKSSR